MLNPETTAKPLATGKLLYFLPRLRKSSDVAEEIGEDLRPLFEVHWRSAGIRGLVTRWLVPGNWFSVLFYEAKELFNSHSTFADCQVFY